MKLPRRNFLHLAASAAALPAVSRIAWAQAYPTRPVRIIVGFAPAGAGDIVARLMGQWLSERLGQPFVVENRPGANGNIAAEAGVRAPADGYTLLMVSSANAANAAFYGKLSFNFLRDIAPIASIIRAPYVMAVNPTVPAKTVPEFIAYAKANPGKISMASVGIGSGTHLAGELFKMMAGVNMVHVPYRGGGPAFNDLLGGAGPGHVPHHCRIDRVYQGWYAARARSNHRDALGRAARRPNRRRICAGLRGERLVRRRRAEGHTG
jgi:tripartite-type tricarboxylate transporter receptor subunit TctC